MDDSEFVEKNKRFWRSGPGHYLAVAFEVKVIIDPADLIFELCMNSYRILTCDGSNNRYRVQGAKNEQRSANKG